MGFTLLGLEVLLLLGFQALYGYVYQQLAILVALFMVGMAAGAWLSVTRASRPLWRELPAPASMRGQDARATAGETPALPAALEYLKLAFLQLLAGLAPLLLYALFLLLERVGKIAATLTISPTIFPVLALMAGLLGGYQFPLASRLYFAGSESSLRNPGILYGLDLLGACLGAVALSAYLLPVYGFLRTAILMGVVNLGPTALASAAAREVRVRRT
jgi:spermidine synthase